MARLSREGTFAWIALAASAFHLAYAWSYAGIASLIYLFALVQLANQGPARRRYYAGLAVGFLIAIGRLTFFWTIFSAGAFALWYIYAFWIAVFVAMAGFALDRLGRRAWFLLPFLWAGLEWFRSEGYWLRFSWLTPGFAFADAPGTAPLSLMGVYGTGFLLAAIAALANHRSSVSRAQTGFVLVCGAIALFCFARLPALADRSSAFSAVRAAGIQMEYPSEPEVLARLTQVIHDFPDTQLLVLSEYTFMESVPGALRDWCRKHQRYVVVGAKDPIEGKQFYNTAFVLGPTGETVFRQVKSVPIQFFADGRPAPTQQVWQSPWGRIGFCICYDLSYRRVTDRLVRLGAQALIVPTMDVATWGERQHVLHSRVACVRAAEYGIPIFRVASSGVSQNVTPGGTVVGSLPSFAQGQVLRAVIRLGPSGHLPLDTWLGPSCAFLTACGGAFGLISAAISRFRRLPENSCCR